MNYGKPISSLGQHAIKCTKLEESSFRVKVDPSAKCNAICMSGWSFTSPSTGWWIQCHSKIRNAWYLEKRTIF